MYKVLNISEEGRGGGAIGRIRIIANELKGRINTIIVVPKGSEKYVQSLKQLGLNYREISLYPMTTDFKGAILYFIFFIPEVISLACLISKEKPDLVHCNGSWQVKGVIASKLVGVSSLWHMNDTYQWRFVEMLFKLLSWLPTGYIYASERTRNYYEKLSKKISNSPFSSVIVAPVDRETIQPIIRSRQSPIKLLLIGYINVHKGIELLLNASAEFKDQEIEIDIVGPILSTRETYVNSLFLLQRELDVSNVSFLGYQKIDTELLSKYHYYICSSIREASPMAVWESLASGLPIISTDVGDVKEVIEKNSCGVISEKLNGESLAKAIRTLIGQTDEEYKEMSKNAVIASDTFDKEQVAKAYLSFYKKVIGE